MIFGIEFACAVLLCQTEQPHSLDIFIGSNGCRAELRSEASEFGLALDRKQNAYADVREINGKPTLLVIQYGSGKDRCGIVKDIVVAPNAKDVFEFDCTDNVDAKRVVVGVHPDVFAHRWQASKAWMIDFDRLKLNATSHSVTCMNYNYAGSDEGSDVRTRSAARARKKAH